MTALLCRLISKLPHFVTAANLSSATIGLRRVVRFLTVVREPRLKSLDLCYPTEVD